MVAALAVTLPAFGNDGDGTGLNIGEPFAMSKRLHPGDQYMGITLRGALKLHAAALNGLKPSELSGLAWDADENRLYALSDDGHIVHLRPRFDDNQLVRVDIIDAVPLKNARDLPLEPGLTDAEGLDARNSRNGVSGDTTLAISFERHPRVAMYRPDGSFIEDRVLPSTLQQVDKRKVDERSLAALAVHDKYGLITAPERPSGDQKGGPFALYGLDGSAWQYPPLDPKYSALVGMESMPNGDLLVLERRYSSIFKPVVFSLRRIELTSDATYSATVTAEVARFDTSKGWAIDNFEAVARHEQNRYFMVSDNNDNPVQKTLLFYFEIDGDATAGGAQQRLLSEK